MRQVQTDTLRIEHRERHRVDRLAPVLARHMVDGIDVRAGMFAQFQPVHGRRHDVAIGDALPLFMRGMQRDLTSGRPGNTGIPEKISWLKSMISSMVSGILPHTRAEHASTIVLISSCRYRPAFVRGGNPDVLLNPSVGACASNLHVVEVLVHDLKANRFVEP